MRDLFLISAAVLALSTAAQAGNVSTTTQVGLINGSSTNQIGNYNYSQTNQLGALNGSSTQQIGIVNVQQTNQVVGAIFKHTLSNFNFLILTGIDFCAMNRC